MSVEKVSLTLNTDLLRKARRMAGRRGLSALVNDALRVRVQHEQLRSLLDEMDAEYGPVPAKELEQARKLWPDGPIRKKRKAHRRA